MSNLSRSSFPSGGWSFYQPQTRWTAPAPISNTFDQQVINIIKHRRANPAVTVKHNLSTNPAIVGDELESYTRARLGLPSTPIGSPKMPPPPSSPQMAGGVSQAVAAVKKLASGAALLMEWESSGLPPVAKEVSEMRAATCAVCPQNAQGKSLTEFFTVPLANLTRRKFEKLEGMSLSTSHDAELSVCQACLCPLRLKVHTPMDLIQKRTSAEVRAELDPRCWILKPQ